MALRHGCLPIVPFCAGNGHLTGNWPTELRHLLTWSIVLLGVVTLGIL